jgi:hypothetical protein
LNLANNTAFVKGKEFLPFGDSFERSLIAALSIRAQGNMSLCYGDVSNSIGNRETFLKKIGINFKDLVCAKQTHSGNVRYVTESDKGKGALVYDDAIEDTDAFITDKKGVPIAIFTADCLPVFLYDPRKPAIGLAHGGWRSTKKNIAFSAIELMQKQFGTDPKDLLVGFGPGIRSCCFEAEEDFKQIFPKDTQERNGKLYVDLAGANRRQLLEAGVKAENIFDYRICTVCGVKDLYSFRVEKDKSGRMISVMMLI